MAIAKWQLVSGGFGASNYLLQLDGFYISFNPNPSSSMFGAAFASDDGGPETALCYGGRYYILNGDFRDAYERLVPAGLDACKAFYRQQSAHAESSWANKETT